MACSKDAECDHIDGKGVCDDGTCVQCTADDDSVCDGKVCDVTERACSDGMPNEKTLCEECVATKQCLDGQVCVALKFGSSELDDGKRCVWDKSSDASGAPNGSCLSVAPFIGTESNLENLEGDSVEICALRLTSCTAYEQFSVKKCDSEDATGHAQCGLADEGYCMTFDAEFRCTMPCEDVDDDCKSTSSTCTAFVDSSTGKVCDFGL